MKLQSAPVGELPDKSDDERFRHSFAQHEGYRVGAYVQTPPLLFNATGHPLWLGDQYLGRSVFLVCGGPSIKNLPIEKLKAPGVIVAGINNSAKTIRPNIWFSVDSPSNFLLSIWKDPLIQKIVPMCGAEKALFDSRSWDWANLSPRECPNVAYFRRNERFKAKQFLWEDTINWGCHKKYGGGRSVMLAAVRVLFYLGFRRVFLLGADFDMSPTTTYNFDQPRTSQSVKNNNDTYRMLQKRFTQLRPLFEREKFRIFNCNPKSNLTAFDFTDFDSALKAVVSELGIDTAAEPTSHKYPSGDVVGMYDREAYSRTQAKAAKKEAAK